MSFIPVLHNQPITAGIGETNRPQAACPQALLQIVEKVVRRSPLSMDCETRRPAQCQYCPGHLSGTSLILPKTVFVTGMKRTRSVESSTGSAARFAFQLGHNALR